MKIRESGKALIGGFVVYVAMAACTAAGPGAISGGGNSGGSGHGGSGHGGSVASGEGGTQMSTAGGDQQSVSGVGGYDAGDIWDALTDPVPNASADPVSGSRLKARFRLADDGSKEYIPGSWYDSQRQDECYFQLAEDGIPRCLPGTTATQSYYLDTACTQKYIAVYPSSECPSPPKPKYASTSGATPGTCAYLLHIYSVGAQVIPANVYYLNGATCTKSAPSAGYVYYSVGAEIPATSFVGSTVMHD